MRTLNGVFIAITSSGIIGDGPSHVEAQGSDGGKGGKTLKSTGILRLGGILLGADALTKAVNLPNESGGEGTVMLSDVEPGEPSDTVNCVGGASVAGHADRVYTRVFDVTVQPHRLLARKSRQQGSTLRETPPVKRQRDTAVIVEIRG